MGKKKSTAKKTEKSEKLGFEADGVKYEFTCPSFKHDGVKYISKDVVAAAEEGDEASEVILATLVKIGSGVIKKGG